MFMNDNAQGILRMFMNDNAQGILRMFMNDNAQGILRMFMNDKVMFDCYYCTNSAKMKEIMAH